MITVKKKIFLAVISVLAVSGTICLFRTEGKKVEINRKTLLEIKAGGEETGEDNNVRAEERQIKESPVKDTKNIEEAEKKRKTRLKQKRTIKKAMKR